MNSKELYDFLGTVNSDAILLVRVRYRDKSGLTNIYFAPVEPVGHGEAVVLADIDLTSKKNVIEETMDRIENDEVVD